MCGGIQRPQNNAGQTQGNLLIYMKHSNHSHTLPYGAETVTKSPAGHRRYRTQSVITKRKDHRDTTMMAASLINLSKTPLQFHCARDRISSPRDITSILYNFLNIKK